MKFGVRSAVDVVFKTTRAYTGNGEDFLLKRGQSWAKGEPVLYFDTLKSSTSEGTATTTYARGGDGNVRLVAWEGDKEITFTFEDALISIEGMSILTGAGLLEASNSNKVKVNKKAIVTATITSGTATASLTSQLESYEAFVATDIFGFIVSPNGDIVERLGKAKSSPTPTAASISFNTEADNGTAQVLIDYYVERNSGVKEITITPDKFAGYFYIEGDTLFRRQSDGKDLAAKMIIPNAKIQTAFNFSMSPEGDPSTFTFTADAFPGTLYGDISGQKTMYALQLVDEE